MKPIEETPYLVEVLPEVYRCFGEAVGDPALVHRLALLHVHLDASDCGKRLLYRLINADGLLGGHEGDDKRRELVERLRPLFEADEPAQEHEAIERIDRHLDALIDSRRAKR